MDIWTKGIHLNEWMNEWMFIFVNVQSHFHLPILIYFNNFTQSHDQLFFYGARCNHRNVHHWSKLTVPTNCRLEFLCRQVPLSRSVLGQNTILDHTYCTHVYTHSCMTRWCADRSRSRRRWDTRRLFRPTPVFSCQCILSRSSHFHSTNRSYHRTHLCVDYAHLQ